MEKFAQSAIDVITLACETSEASGLNAVGSEVLLLGLLNSPGRCSALLIESGLEQQRTAEYIKATASATRAHKAGKLLRHFELPLSADGRKILLTAHAETLIDKRDLILEEHLLLAIIREKETVAGLILSQMKIDLRQLRKRVRDSAMNSDEVAVTGSEGLNWPGTIAARAEAYDFSQSRFVRAVSTVSGTEPSQPEIVTSLAVRLETDAFSADTVQILATAQRIALGQEVQCVDEEHLFYAALLQNSS